MTDNEIIKALECCRTTSCDNCPYSGDDLLRDCNENLIGDALNLINRLQAEKEALINGQETLQKHIAEQKVEIEMLKAYDEMADGYAEAVEQNAIKEFAERLKECETKAFGSKCRVIPLYCIDNLVKEMTEKGGAE